jgi:hypothetical protein
MSRSRYLVWLALSVAWFIFVELVFSTTVPFHADEFQGAHAAYRLTHQIPYRDFLPYKTVLGYYVQLPPLLLAGPGWAGLTAARIYTTAINALALTLVGLALGRRYRLDAAALSMVLLVFVSTFLDQAFEIRVDMLTGWVGVSTLLLLLASHPVAAGAMAGLAFLVSQKGLFYIVAGMAALVAVACTRGRGRSGWADVLRFGAATSLVILAYLGLWVAIAGVRDVLFITFPAAAGIARRAVYEGIRLRWLKTAFRNPIFYGAALLGLGRLAVLLWHGWRQRGAGGPPAVDKHILLLIFATVLLAQMAVYPQPWSYLFLLAIPVLAIVIADWLDAIMRGAEAMKMSVPVTFLVVGLGVLYPSIYTLGSMRGDRATQRSAYEAGETALHHGGAYWAGSNVYATKIQPRGLEWLDRYNLERLRGLPEADIEALLSALDSSPPALVFDTYRIRDLPDPFRRFVERNYRPLSGLVHSYVVELVPGAYSVSTPVRGMFKLDAVDSVLVGSDWLGPGETFLVASDSVTIETDRDAMLQFVGGFAGGSPPAGGAGQVEFFGYR